MAPLSPGQAGNNSDPARLSQASPDQTNNFTSQIESDDQLLDAELWIPYTEYPFLAPYESFEQMNNLPIGPLSLSYDQPGGTSSAFVDIGGSHFLDQIPEHQFLGASFADQSILDLPVDENSVIQGYDHSVPPL